VLHALSHSYSSSMSMIVISSIHFWKSMQMMIKLEFHFIITSDKIIDIRIYLIRLLSTLEKAFLGFH
jgi:hypothetical protein